MTLPERVALFERRAVSTFLRRAGGNVALAAFLAGYNRTAFIRLMKRHRVGNARMQYDESELHRSIAKWF